MADDLSLLFRLKGDNTQLKRVTSDFKQEIAQLRQSFGPQLTQTLTVANKAFGSLGDSLTSFAAQRLPLIGGALTRVTEGLGAVSAESATAGASIASLAGPIGIAVAALVAEAAAVIALTKEIFALTKAAADYQGKLLDLSQQTGVAVETLSALEVVARTTGGSIDGLTQSLGIFQRNLQEAVEDRGSKAAVAFNKLGVEARDTETALRQTVAALARMPEGFRQTALALEVFGRGGKAFLAIAKESNGNIDEIIEKFGRLGGVTTEQAKLADQFNDQLEILSIQLRGIGTEAIPVVLDALKQLSKELEDNRDLFNVLQGIIEAVALTITVPLRGAIGVIRDELTKARVILAVTAEYFERIKAAIEFIAGHPISFPSLTGAAPTPAAPATPTPQTDPIAEGIRDQIEARKRLQAVLGFDYAQEQQRAQDRIALAQRELEAGKRTRQQLLDATIEGTRQQTKAQIDQLQFERDIKLREAALAKDDIQKRDQIGAAILAIDTQVANKRSEQARNEADLRAKAQLDERKAELASEQSRADVLIRLGQERVTKIEDLIQRERVVRSIGLEEIEKIENASLAARADILKKELALVGVGPDRQAVLDKIKALEVDRTTLERTQSERRRQLSKEEFEEKRQILTTNLDALLQVEQIRGNAQIATIQAQAALRIKTEEQAAKEILAIRLGLLDSEIAATEAKQKAAAGITDPRQRRQEQSQSANDLKILSAERTAIQEQGNQDIEEKRKEDLENERRYADELKAIKERIRRTEQDAATEVIRLMVLHFASRRDIIRARLQQDIADENSRHLQAEETIRGLEQENRESNKTQQEKLEAEHEINLLREAEAERHRLAMQGIKDQGKRDEEEASPLGRFNLDTESLKEFASVIEDSIVPLGEILRSTFLQVADAIGQTVQNWVLLGETGPAVMRKILAQALASIAAEAAVNAIKELALGFATLFFNPAESAAHFTAAALWGSIGIGTALAGRAVAGDLFKPKQASGGATGSSSAGSRTGTTQSQTQPVTIDRNSTQPQRVVVELQFNGALGDVIEAQWVQKYREGGKLRNLVMGDQES